MFTMIVVTNFNSDLKVFVTTNYGDIADGFRQLPVISTYEKLDGGLNNCTVRDAFLATLAEPILFKPITIGICNFE